jgi:hypothetical protein
MTRDELRRLARAIIAPAGPAIPDAALDAALDVALAIYTAHTSPTLALTLSATPGATDTDDHGDYTTYTINNATAAEALADPATILTISDTRPAWRLTSATPTSATIRIYATNLPDPTPLTLWRPAIPTAHPDAHAAPIAMLAAASYLLSESARLAQANQDRASDSLSDLSSTLYGRATQLLRRS